MPPKPITTKTLILLLLAFAGVAGYLVKAGKISWPGGDGGTRGWKTYINNHFGFEMKYPSHYRVSTTAGGDDGMSLESDYAFIDFRDLQSVADLAGEKKVVANGFEGIEYPISGNMDGGIEFEVLFRTPNSRNGFLSILFTTKQKGYEAKIDEFMKILSTFKFANNKLSSTDTAVLGETIISFSNTSNDIYLKSEISIFSTVVRYPNSELRTITNVYSQDYDYDPVKLADLNPSGYKWTTLVREPIYIGADDGNILVDDRLFSFKRIPDTNNFLFVVEWMRSSESTTRSRSPDKFERVLYMYDENKVGQKLKRIAVFNNKSSGYTFPKIGSFSPDGRYVSLDLFGCWNCGGHQPEKLLLDTQSFSAKNIGKVSQFSWVGDGNYEYKEYIVGDCEDDEPRVCFRDPSTLPLRVGKMEI